MHSGGKGNKTTALAAKQAAAAGGRMGNGLLLLLGINFGVFLLQSVLHNGFVAYLPFYASQVCCSASLRVHLSTISAYIRTCTLLVRQKHQAWPASQRGRNGALVQTSWWQYVSHAFYHSDFGHLSSNMFMLWAFGRSLEADEGTGELIFYYVMCAIGVSACKGATLIWSTLHCMLDASFGACHAHNCFADIATSISDSNRSDDFAL